MRRILIILARLALAAVFLVAAIVKLRQPWLLFAASIDSWQILPAAGVLFVARVLPWTELLLGILLLLGIKMRYVAPFATGLLLIFFSFMVKAYLSGLEIDCGCFGPGEALGPKTLARDGAMLAVSAWVTFESFRRNETEIETIVTPVPVAELEVD
jgi:uncharacterized membrane protein YphA (DoxX/SURF4 family)